MTTTPPIDPTVGDDDTPRPDPAPEDTAEEHQPASAAEVQDAADEVEQLGQHRRSFDDAAGINPDRSQDSGGDPADRPDERRGRGGGAPD